MLDGIAGPTALGYDVIALRLGVALALTMLLGVEREQRDKPAGLRTHMLVGLGAAMFYIAGIEIVAQLKANDIIQSDPVRIVEGLVGGIGFLGAGAILRNDDRIKGLTTAAGIWVAGAVGLCAGAGLFALAAIGAVAAFILLRLFGMLGQSIGGGDADSATER